MGRPDESKREAEAPSMPGGCCCVDSYAGLPAEVRPKPAPKRDALRQVTCPRCGLIYSTNRKTTMCVRCEEKEPS